MNEAIGKLRLLELEPLKLAIMDALQRAWSFMPPLHVQAKEGASGVYFASVVEKMGIAGELKPRLNLAASGAQVGEKIAAGEAELGALLINEIMALKGVEVAGPLPAALQSYTVFHAGVAAGSKNAAAARALIQHLTTPAAAKVFKAKGQEPG